MLHAGITCSFPRLENISACSLRGRLVSSYFWGHQEYVRDRGSMQAQTLVSCSCPAMLHKSVGVVASDLCHRRKTEAVELRTGIRSGLGFIQESRRRAKFAMCHAICDSSTATRAARANSQWSRPGYTNSRPARRAVPPPETETQRSLPLKSTRRLSSIHHWLGTSRDAQGQDKFTELGDPTTMISAMTSACPAYAPSNDDHRPNPVLIGESSRDKDRISISTSIPAPLPSNLRARCVAGPSGPILSLQPSHSFPILQRYSAQWLQSALRCRLALPPGIVGARSRQRER